jgi:hypothetical protein
MNIDTKVTIMLDVAERFTQTSSDDKEFEVNMITYYPFEEDPAASAYVYAHRIYKSGGRAQGQPLLFLTEESKVKVAALLASAGALLRSQMRMEV